MTAMGGLITEHVITQAGRNDVMLLLLLIPAHGHCEHAPGPVMKVATNMYMS